MRLRFNQQRASELLEQLEETGDWESVYPDLVAEEVGASVDDVVRTYQKVQDSFANLPIGTQVLHRSDYEFPSALKKTEECPPFLFCQGNTSLLNRPIVAVVGTRRASTEGRRRAEKMSVLLSRRGIVVASGLAKGIDHAAHRGALEAEGDTIAVIGTPLHKTYPKQHEDLQITIAERGLVVSQFAPAFPVRRWFFPQRNATMSGISMATVVIEAAETSGAVIQAKYCLQQGRQLFLPKSLVDDRRFDWSRKFLRFPQVHMFSSVSELLQMLNDAVGSLDDSKQTKHEDKNCRVAAVFKQISFADVR